jgi:hypothetical protein
LNGSISKSVELAILLSQKVPFLVRDSLQFALLFVSVSVLEFLRSKLVNIFFAVHSPLFVDDGDDKLMISQKERELLTSWEGPGQEGGQPTLRICISPALTRAPQGLIFQNRWK